MELPEAFIRSTDSLLKGDNELFLSAIEEDAPVSVRLNPGKVKRNPMAFTDAAQPVPWSHWGYYLQKRPAFTFDPLFHAGYYYVQEASSMFVEHLIRRLINRPVVALDLCGAPGGKSVSMLSALPADSLLVSNEMVRQRANVLSETLIKFGDPNCVVTQNHPADFSSFNGLFDLILVDAPCSGEGMFRKEKVAVSEWSPGNVEMCATRQRDILSDIWPALKPGGVLIYSTCTYNKAENEENVLWAATTFDAQFIEVETDGEWGITPSLKDGVVSYRFFPHKTLGEGLFVTLLKKSDSAMPEADRSSRALLSQKKSRVFSTVTHQSRSDYSRLLEQPELFHFTEADRRITALPTAHLEIIHSFRERLKILSIGFDLGELKGKDFIPSHILAMNQELNRKAFFNIELSYEQAIAYLRNEALILRDAPKGFLLLTFQHEPIGFVKNVGNRANNHYPGEWRIRSSHLPEVRPEILKP